MRQRVQPEVSAGSMADIAFLLLIFFLVTATIETDAGIDRKLPPKNQPPPPKIKEKNILRIVLNKKSQIMVEGDIIPIDQLKSTVYKFLDNGGINYGQEGYCDYCMGKRNSDSSDNPVKAVVSLKSDREAFYATYIAIQDCLEAAYTELRNREALRLFKINYEDLETKYYDPYTPDSEKSKLKIKIEKVRNMYPLKISEAQTK